MDAKGHGRVIDDNSETIQFMVLVLTPNSLTYLGYYRNPCHMIHNNAIISLYV